MSDLFPESERSRQVRFLPDQTEPLSGEEAFDRLQDALELELDDVDLIVSAPTPRRIGRSWAFDWNQERFVQGRGEAGPARTYGDETLRQWCMKALQTARGAHPIHPPGYGLVRRADLIGGPVDSPPLDLEDRVRDALTFHPDIADVQGFGVDHDPDEEFAAVSFTVITRHDDVGPANEIAFDGVAVEA